MTPLSAKLGPPAECPWRLALVKRFHFAENLSARWAADAARSPIDRADPLAPARIDTGFDASVASEVRGKPWRWSRPGWDSAGTVLIEGTQLHHGLGVAEWRAPSSSPTSISLLAGTSRAGGVPAVLAANRLATPAMMTLSPAVMVRSPAGPAPAVPVAMNPPSVIARQSTETVAGPPAPSPRRVVVTMLPPEATSSRGAVIVTRPPAPEPAVKALSAPRSAMVTDSLAATVTLPAGPVSPVYDARGNVLVQNDDAVIMGPDGYPTTDRNPRLAFVAPAIGTYFLGASGYGGATDGYAVGVLGDSGTVAPPYMLDVPSG